MVSRDLHNPWNSLEKILKLNITLYKIINKTEASQLLTLMFLRKIMEYEFRKTII